MKRRACWPVLRRPASLSAPGLPKAPSFCGRSSALISRMLRSVSVNLPAPSRVLMQEQQVSCLCYIDDISEAGAPLVLENECELPERFILLLSRKGDARRQCRLVWRDGLTVGVAFSAPEQS